MGDFDPFLEIHPLTTERAFTVAELAAMNDAGVPGSEVPADLPKRLVSFVVRVDDCG